MIYNETTVIGVFPDGKIIYVDDRRNEKKITVLRERLRYLRETQDYYVQEGRKADSEAILKMIDEITETISLLKNGRFISWPDINYIIDVQEKEKLVL